jgi:putative endonuclease
MYFTYVLLSKRDGRFYIGHTNNLTERIERHNVGRVPATKYRIPVEMIYSETFESKSEAANRERYLKSRKGGNQFRKIIGVQGAARHPAKGGTLPGSPEGTSSEESWRPSVESTKCEERLKKLSYPTSVQHTERT